jgi:Leucine-rich repeat (LRR) protein
MDSGCPSCLHLWHQQLKEREIIPRELYILRRVDRSTELLLSLQVYGLWPTTGGSDLAQRGPTAMLYSMVSMLSMQVFLFVVVVAVGAPGAEGGCVGNISKSAYAALEDFYDSLDGANWLWNYSDLSATVWTFPSGLNQQCSYRPWYGLACEAVVDPLAACDIVSLSLPSFGLTGDLPDSLGVLTKLTVLSLESNNIHRSLPQSIGNIQGLRRLSLDRNLISGSVSANILNLTLLSNISISSNFITNLSPRIDLPQAKVFLASLNHLTGDLPDFSSSSAMVVLDLSANMFDGTLLESYGFLVGLTSLALNSNYLRGPIPEALYSLSNLLYLELDFNHFNGSLSSSIANLSALSSLDFSNNLMSGSVPTELGQLTDLTYVSLDENHMVGNLPWQIGLLTNLQLLSFADNYFSGPVPTEYGFLKLKLSYVDLQRNLLTSTIPTELGTLSDLMYLYLFYNNLSGQLPTELGRLSSCVSIELFRNSLTGQIPSELYLLTRLEELQLGNCFLDGIIASGVGNLSSLSILELAFNFFTKSLPAELGDAVQINQFICIYNEFSGVVPSQISGLRDLQVLQIANNRFSGSLSSTVFASMANLSSVYLSANFFSGNLPDQFGEVSTIHYYDASGNLFTGKISDVFFQLANVQDLNLEFNMLTAPIPTENEFVKLESLILNNNYISQTIPSTLTKLRRLKALLFQDNVLSGSISAELFTGNNELEAVDFGANLLSHTIPDELSSLLHLQVLNMSMNSLTGKLENLFRNETSFNELQILDLSLNGLSGPLPNNMFRVDALTVTVLYSNCFSGSLPETICAASQLTTLVMDALSSAPRCRKKFPPILNSVLKAVISQDPIQGTIPSCIWTMPALQTLHLSGNGLSGTLSDLVTSLNSLQDVSLASNRITGTLPLSWQTWGNFTQLDLASNKLEGTLSNHFIPGLNNTKLDLTVNRLSGDIPHSLETASNVDILNGNLFQCTSNSLPAGDPDKESYVCGSDDFNISLIVWVSLFAGAVVYTRFDSVFWRRLVKSASLDLDVSGDSSTDEFIIFLKSACWCCTAVGLLSIAGAMPLYISFKLTRRLAALYSTHQVQYAWVTSVAYLHGTGPTIVVVLILMMVVSFSSIGLAGTRRKPTDSLEAPERLKWSFDSWYLALSRYFWTTVVLTVHMLVTVVVNVFYIYALIAGVSAWATIILQAGLSIFKLTWNTWTVSWLLKKLTLSNENRLTCATFMGLFTFLVSPFIATFFSDTTCFRYVITEEPTVSSSFYSKQFGCDLVCFSVGTNGADCFDLCAVSDIQALQVFTTVSPTWLYGYQCSSSIITNYTPVLVFAFTISGIVIPACKMLFLRLPRQLINNYIPTYIQTAMMSNIYTPVVSSSQDALLTDLQSRRPFNPYSILSRSCLNVAVMGTFGLASPLLSVVVMVDVWVGYLIFRHQIVCFLAPPLYSGGGGSNTSVSRISSMPGSNEAGDVGALRDRLYSSGGNRGIELLDKTTSGVLVGIQSSVWIIVIILASFWSFFVFDMMGDVYGVNTGALLIILPSAGCMIVFVAVGYMNSQVRSTKSLVGLNKPLLLGAEHVQMNEAF